MMREVPSFSVSLVQKRGNFMRSTLEILLASTDAIESGITPGKPVKPDSE